jgi:hypothetical protein
MAGGSGCEWYFGYKHAHNDLGLEDFRSRDRMWDQSRHAASFFREHLPFERMSAADGCVRREGAFVFAAPGEVYAVYLPPSISAAEPARLFLPEARFSVAWFDPRHGGPLQKGSVETVSGPGFQPLGAPPADPPADWVVLVRLDGPPPADVPAPPE